VCRDTLITALARFALENGIDTYTGVADWPWLQQVLRFGWDCSLLGTPQKVGNGTLGALRIDIHEDTVERLERGGIRCAAEPAIPASRAA